MNEALTIYQEHLDRVTQALWTGDDDAMANLLSLPNCMRTEDGEILLETPEAIIKAARDFRRFLDRSGAREYHRIAREARFHPTDANRIDGTHDTYILRGGQYVMEPYLNHQVLVREAGVWRGSEIRAEVRNAHCTILSPDQLRQVTERKTTVAPRSDAQGDRHA